MKSLDQQQAEAVLHLIDTLQFIGSCDRIGDIPSDTKEARKHIRHLQTFLKSAQFRIGQLGLGEVQSIERALENAAAFLRNTEKD